MRGLLQFFVGVLLVQVATALLVAVGLRTHNAQLWGLLALLGAALGLLTAFWFSTLLAHARQRARADLEARFLREREKLRVRSEREKQKIAEKSRVQAERARRRNEVKQRGRSTLVFTTVAVAGGVLLFTQFMTFGLLLMTGAGGALAGYALRMKQALPRREPKATLEQAPPPRLIRKE